MHHGRSFLEAQTREIETEALKTIRDLNAEMAMWAQKGPPVVKVSQVSPYQRTPCKAHSLHSEEPYDSTLAPGDRYKSPISSSSMWECTQISPANSVQGSNLFSPQLHFSDTQRRRPPPKSKPTGKVAAAAAVHFANEAAKAASEALRSVETCCIHAGRNSLLSNAFTERLGRNDGSAKKEKQLHTSGQKESKKVHRQLKEMMELHREERVGLEQVRKLLSFKQLYYANIYPGCECSAHRAKLETKRN